MSPNEAKSPSCHLERHDDAVVLALTGDWIASETGVRSATEVQQILEEARAGALRIDAAHLGRWDSALIAWAKLLSAYGPTPSTLPCSWARSSCGMRQAWPGVLALVSAMSGN